jgi:hypothetical protein
MSQASETMLRKWGVPNAINRSALFCTRNLGNKRSNLICKEIHSQVNYKIIYSGPEMNQYDAQILYAIAHIQRRNGQSFGTWVKTYYSEIASLINRKANGEAYKSISDSLDRLSDCKLRIIFGSNADQVTYKGGILESYAKTAAKHLEFRLSPDLEDLFKVDCTIVNLEHKVKLNRLFSKWLYDFSSSHSLGIPFYLTNIINLCGYSGNMPEFKRQLNLACIEIEETLGENSPFVRHSIQNNELCLYKQHKKGEISISNPSEQSNNPFL